MQELIKIQKQLIGAEEVNSVNARELHVELGVKKDFSDWVSHQINSLGLEINIDYVTSIESSNGGRPQKSYTLTLDAAKHIAMASRTAKGKEVRAYFIAAEKQFRTTTHSSNMSSSDLQQILPIMMEMMSAIKNISEALLRQGEAIASLASAIEQNNTLAQENNRFAKTIMMDVDMGLYGVSETLHKAHMNETIDSTMRSNIRKAVTLKAKELSGIHDIGQDDLKRLIFGKFNSKFFITSYDKLLLREYEIGMRFIDMLELSGDSVDFKYILLKD